MCDPLYSACDKRFKANNLTIALPKEYGKHIITQSFFNRNLLQKPLDRDIYPDILTNHVRYSSDIEKTFPTAKKITIVRDPVGQFVSEFEYFHHLGTEFR